MMDHLLFVKRDDNNNKMNFAITQWCFRLNPLGFNQAWQKTMEINPSSIWILGLRFTFAKLLFLLELFPLKSIHFTTHRWVNLHQFGRIESAFSQDQIPVKSPPHTEIAIQLTELFRHFYDYKYNVRRFHIDI